MSLGLTAAKKSVLPPGSDPAAARLVSAYACMVSWRPSLEVARPAGERLSPAGGSKYGALLGRSQGQSPELLEGQPGLALLTNERTEPAQLATDEVTPPGPGRCSLRLPRLPRVGLGQQPARADVRPHVDEGKLGGEESPAQDGAELSPDGGNGDLGRTT